jgi:hypothetical protein
MMTATDYQELIRAILERRMPIEDFEARYLAAVKAEPGGMESGLYEIVQDLFDAVDAYSPKCSAGDETPVVISEVRLRREAREALDRLKRYGMRKAEVAKRA